mmetsp:Transcript_9585/g.13724  ORF Transcript_9585/g.13724 Transcript_9585/m.13724 type:complete len:133 (+) Transcript_9585:364-762(+)
MIVQYKAALVGWSQPRHIPHTAANKYMICCDSSPDIIQAAKEVLMMNTIKHNNALRSGLIFKPIIPPSFEPGMPATKTQRKTAPICELFMLSTCIIYVVEIVERALVALSDNITDSKKYRRGAHVATISEDV